VSRPVAQAERAGVVTRGTATTGDATETTGMAEKVVVGTAAALAHEVHAAVNAAAEHDVANALAQKTQL